jgi:hypothetical protein
VIHGNVFFQAKNGMRYSPWSLLLRHMSKLQFLCIVRARRKLGDGVSRISTKEAVRDLDARMIQIHSFICHECGPHYKHVTREKIQVVEADLAALKARVDLYECELNFKLGEAAFWIKADERE